MIQTVRKSTPRFTRFPSLVLIRPVLTEINRFENVKIYEEMYGIWTLSEFPYMVMFNKQDGGRLVQHVYDKPVAISH